MSKRALLILSLGFGLSAEAAAAPSGAGYPAANAYAQPAATDNAIFEVLGRLEQLQSEVQQLRGMVEEQSQTIADLQRKQSNMYSDLDDRMQALTAGGQTPQSQSPAPAPADTAATGQAAVTAAQPSAPAAPVAPTPAPVATATPAPVAPVADNKPAAAQGNEKERYQSAYDTLRNGHNAQAIKMFQDLLKDFPAGEFADNSQYWLAEAYKINREFDAARAAFNKVVSQYPNSSKVPDALLKLGYIEFDLQNTAKARDYLTRVTTSYPGTTAAHLAEKKLAQMPQ
ncbi:MULTISPECIES: tol-pal system protein YbgF [Methylomonas]|uniref:Cell division coordinator CpoB n=2 Tax=Methylomonas TaxID=416 RepID=A0A126T781_9GAMM|nr:MULTISPECIES: tol-pal system protein YbgF [Methylomonas]AMK77624.1 tol-pal system protein [Methylomonas denitrificans]OAH96881.1 tol-pal system protein [Methylomonas methanica]TCV86793.1 tol-pal system protein YbgF [Methylomonas methanica]